MSQQEVQKQPDVKGKKPVPTPVEEEIDRLIDQVRKLKRDLYQAGSDQRLIADAADPDRPLNP